MAIALPESARSSGCVNEPPGTHTSRTIMLGDLRRLLAVCPPLAELADYRAAAIDNNALMKNTLATRRWSFRALRELYALNPAVLVFRGLRDLWDDDPEAQPAMALLCAAARDPILRATADLILATRAGEPLTPELLAQAVSEALPERYVPTSLAKIGRNVASSWQQSGHLQGRLVKLRSRAVCRPAAVAYALFLGYLCGERGNGLFQTLWARLLDSPMHVLREQAILVTKRGWLEYRYAGDVTDVGFRHLLRNTG